jgi:hypothetical protein
MLTWINRPRRGYSILSAKITRIQDIAMRSIAILLATPLALCVFDSFAGEAVTAAADLNHGRKLYEASCDACHSANVHWRDKRLVDSWPALVHEVKRWQANSSQHWEAADINDVAAYLNQRFYHLPCPANECAEKEAAR